MRRVEIGRKLLAHENELFHGPWVISWEINAVPLLSFLGTRNRDFKKIFLILNDFHIAVMIASPFGSSLQRGMYVCMWMGEAGSLLFDCCWVCGGKQVTFILWDPQLAAALCSHRRAVSLYRNAVGEPSIWGVNDASGGR